MRIGVYFVVAAAVWGGVVFGQDAGSGMKPELGYSFPFQQGANEVLIKNAVLINKECIIPAGSKARVIYTQPKEGDAVVKKERRRLEDRNDAYNRVPDKAQKTEMLSPVERAALEIAMKTIWESETAFRAALERTQRDYLRFVYQVPGSSDPLIENLEFPQGLLLMEDGGKVVVLSVVTGSPGERAGIVAGSEVVSLNGQDLKGKLTEFQKAYFTATDSNKKRQIDWGVKLPKSDEVKVISTRLPMSLDTDMWSITK